jgi:hypothetical protein
VFVGPLDAITPTPNGGFLCGTTEVGIAGARSSAQFTDRAPQSGRRAVTAYVDSLDAMRKSAGLEMFANPRITAGVAYVGERGQVGTVGFELPPNIPI